MRAIPIRLRMLYEKVSAFIPDVRVDMIGNIDLDITITGLRLYSSHDIFPPGYVYFCSPDDLPGVDTANDDIILVCVNNNKSSLPILPDNCGNIIIITTEVTLPKAFNSLFEAINIAQSINMNMYENILEKRDIQETLLLGESLLTNVYMLLDARFKLKGYSKNRKSDNELYNDTITNGALNTKYIMQMVTNNIPAQLRQQGEILLPEHNIISDAPVFIKQIIDGDVILGFGILICVNTPPMLNMMFYFSTFINNFGIFLRDDKNENYNLQRDYELFLIDMINQRISDEVYIRNRALILQIPPDDRYFLLRVTFNKLNNIPLDYAFEQLELLMDERSVFCYMDGFQILLKEKRAKYHLQEQCLAAYRRYMKRFNAVCGISDVFEGLINISQAFSQACAAVNHGKVFTAANQGTYYYCYDDTEFHYRNYTTIDMIHQYYCNNQCLPSCLPQLRLLLKHDKKKNTNNAQLLFVYLQNERKINKTASDMFMYRNSLIYRLQSIEAIIGNNLDDLVFRESLLFSYRVLDYAAAYAK